MTCEKCSNSMNFLYDVIERETAFVLWECDCGNKLLERRPADKALVGVGMGVSTGAATLTLSGEDDED